MFAAQENKEHVVFLQYQYQCWIVRSGLIQVVSHTYELASLNIKRSIDCGDARQIMSLYDADRKHVLVNKCILLRT